MSESKFPTGVQGAPYGDVGLAVDEPVVSEKQGTHEDVKDMHRMGKMQEMRRNFRFISMFAYSMVLMATWETMLATSAIGLINGGPAGVIWVFLGTAAGMLCVIVSMAEMASMAPTSGGQYHWVSEFAPKRRQRFLSYLVGWLCVLGWQTGTASSGYLAGTMIQALIALNNPDYGFQRWHGTLLIIAIASYAVIFNTFLARRLPMVETVALLLHIFAFFAIIITLWVLSPRVPAKEVFTTFQDNGGWSNKGLSCLIGMLSPVFALIGPDSAAHMSEELRDASWTLPRTMIWSMCVNSAMGFVMVITLMFCVGDVPSVLESRTRYPFVQVIFNATNSTAGTSVLTALIITMSTFGCVNNVATASRQLFAFARDQGIPFASFLSHVRHDGWDIPLNAVLVSFVVCVLLSLINIGSTVAFNCIASLGIGALITSYIVSISCMLVKRWRNEPLLPRKFNLGRSGLVINLVSVLYLLLVFVISFFPTSPNPTAEDMNWSILIYGVVVAFAILYFFVVGRHHYAGPVEYVNKDW